MRRRRSGLQVLGEAKAPCDLRSSPALGGPPHAGNQAVPGPESLAQGHKLPAHCPGARFSGVSVHQACSVLSLISLPEKPSGHRASPPHVWPGHV